jgi:hypothetical protein
MLCHGMSCSQCFKGTIFLCISLNFRTHSPNDSHIQEAMKHQQHNCEILISWIFKEMLSSSDYLENGGSKLIHNICNYLPIYMVPYRNGSPSSLTMLQKPQTYIICVLYFNVGLEPQKHCC